MGCTKCGTDTLVGELNPGARCWSCRFLSGDEAVMLQAVRRQRGITLDEIGTELGVTREYVRQALLPSREMAAKTKRRWLRDIDRAITSITERRGGPYATTGTTLAGAVEMGRIIQGKDEYTRIRDRELEVVGA